MIGAISRSSPPPVPTSVPAPATPAAEPTDQFEAAKQKQHLKSARVDTLLSKGSLWSGLALGAACVLLPLPGIALALGAVGMPLLGRETSRMWFRKAHSGEAFVKQLQTWENALNTGGSLLNGLHLKTGEMTLLQDLVKVPNADAHFHDFFDGAYMRINDGGQLYNQWSRLPGVQERISSHASMGKQYEMDGHVTGPVLFGKTADGKATWIQMERDSGKLTPRSLVDLPLHLEDYIEYKVSHRNQSRYGTSPYTEHNPLVLG